MDIEKKIEQLLKKVIEKSEDRAILKELPFINLTWPRLKKFGDLSSNIALVIGQKTGSSSLEIARKIQKAVQKELRCSNLLRAVDRVEIAGAGFLNFFLSKNYLYEILLEIRKKKSSFGRTKLGRGKKINIEFASANPTGPLNIAHGRQAAFGDILANLLQFSGYRVVREYYLNDEGVQIDILGQSLRSRYLRLLGIEAEFPPSGYQGKYIDDLAEQFLKKYGRKFSAEKERENLAFFSNFALRKILEGIKTDLAAFGVKFDSWFSQKQLSKTNKITEALDFLRGKGFLYQKEGAWWLTTTRFGDDKDRVVIKSDSNLTYIAPDIAYHKTKFKRGFDRIINIWGPDHHGYISRLKAAVSALGYDAGRITVLIVQLVSIAKSEKIIPMSTRLGQYISLHDIIQAVGKDVARFFFLMRKRDSHLHFDLELAKKQSLENPVYYIQYAHARSINILKFAKMNKSCRMVFNKTLDLSVLDKPEELGLIQTLNNFPTIVESCAESLEPHRMTTYLQDLARDFHHYYEKHKVVTEEPALTQARLILVDAVRIVLNNGLGLLSISAPEKM